MVLDNEARRKLKSLRYGSLPAVVLTYLLKGGNKIKRTVSPKDLHIARYKLFLQNECNIDIPEYNAESKRLKKKKKKKKKRKRQRAEKKLEELNRKHNMRQSFVRCSKKVQVRHKSSKSSDEEIADLSSKVKTYKDQADAAKREAEDYQSQLEAERRLVSQLQDVQGGDTSRLIVEIQEKNKKINETQRTMQNQTSELDQLRRQVKDQQALISQLQANGSGASQKQISELQ